MTLIHPIELCGAFGEAEYWICPECGRVEKHTANTIKVLEAGNTEARHCPFDLIAARPEVNNAADD